MSVIMKNNSFNQRHNNDSNNHRKDNKNAHNNQQGNQHYDKRRQQGQQNQMQQNYQGNQRDQNGQRNRSNNREQSGQRQHPDSSMGRNEAAGLHGPGMPSSSLGSVKFLPGFPTRELPPVETKADPNKKFTGKCRLFVGNIPHNTSEEKIRQLFEPFGEIGEVFLGETSKFAFIKMDTKASAEAARDALDCTQFGGRELRVRLTAHASAIRVKHLSPQVTNELLAYAFRYFGEIERAVVVVDDKGKSICEGIVEFSKKQSAVYAIKKCQQECFLLTAGTKPVLVESYLQHDEEEGLPERSFNKTTAEFNKEREIGPRFAEQGSFEYSFASRWKELYDVEKQKRDAFEKEIIEARNRLEGTISYHQYEHEELSLRKRMQELEEEKRRLQNLREQNMGTNQYRDEQRHQQDMILRQREDEILRRQQESTMKNVPNSMQELLSNQDSASDQQDMSASIPTSTNQVGQESAQTLSMNSMMRPRTFAELAAMNMGQPYIQVPAPPMSLPNQNPQNMFQNYIPPPPIQGSLNGTANFGPYQAGYGTISNDQQTTNDGNNGRNQSRFGPRQYTNPGNMINVTPVGNNSRPRKRSRF